MLYNLAKKTLIEHAVCPDPSSYATGGRNAYYGVVVKDKIIATVHPCHAYMGHGDHKNADFAFTTFWKSTRKQISEDAVKAFFAWMTGEISPWRSILPDNILSDLSWAYDYGFIFDCTLPSNYQHSFLTVSRMVQEWPDWITLWYELITKYGLHPSFAFAYITLWNSCGGDEKRPNSRARVKFAYSDKYDWPLDVVTYSFQYARNFVNGVMSGANKPYNIDVSYRPVNSIFGPKEKFSAYGKGSWQHELFTLYHDKFGSTEEEAKKKFTPGFGRPAFDYIRDWSVTFSEFIGIAKLEQERALLV